MGAMADDALETATEMETITWMIQTKYSSRFFNPIGSMYGMDPMGMVRR